jgi:hypothetical protein
MSMTNNSNNKREKSGNTKCPSMPTKEREETTHRDHAEKGINPKGGAEEKSNKDGPENQGLICQDNRNKCPAGQGSCKVVAGTPCNTHHRCLGCNYCSHSNCRIEMKETEKNKDLSL